MMLWATVNFLLFVALLVRFLRVPIRDYFRARSERLTEGLAAGARARERAEALRATIARDLADLPALRQRLRADLLAAAEREREQLIERGRQAADRIRADARLLAEQEFAAARNALRDELIEDAVRQASALLRQALKPGDQQRLLRDFIASARAA
ncbi:MAG: ATP synthase F0 subunit B [Deltaproteobacteria bacterium]|nr:MAG: ATP synthase F0 subunit B [Deltaproteobacteria bacterium]TMB43444.1 MAG: ATP synthase F0 subunit B [Deltaproteobacteria bacterium]